MHQFSNGATGFDYNAWTSGKSGAEFTTMMKASLDFLEYALSKSDGRIVRLVDVIKWMRNPVALDAPVFLRPQSRRYPGNFAAIERSVNILLMTIPKEGFSSFNRFLADGRTAVTPIPVPLVRSRISPASR